MTANTSPQPAKPVPPTSPAPTTKPVPKGASPRPWKLKALAVGVAGVVLLGAGTWFGSTLPDPTTSDAYVQLAQEKASVEADFKQLDGRYGTLSGEYTTLESGITDREAKASAREEAVAASEKKVGEAQAAVKKREDAVTGAEAKKAKNTVSDGTWTVGTSIEPGTYMATADVGTSCYWGIYTTGSNGSDIVDNDIPGGGRPSVTLSAGQDFKSARCGTWTKQ